MIITEPGIYKDVSIEDYHSSMGISNSGIRDILPPNCPKNYWYKHLSGMDDRKESVSTVIGSAVHTLVLEPETFEDRFYCYPLVDRRTKEGKSIYEKAMIDAQGKVIITDSQMDQVKSMADSLMNHSVYKTYVDLVSGNVEQSIAWIDKESGALLRTRPDYYNEKVIIDIKTSRDVSSSCFARSAHQYGYHSQAAMAIDGLHAMTSRSFPAVTLLVVCNEAPYLTKAYSISGEALIRGRQEYLTGARIFQRCLDFDFWPGYDETVEELAIPRWATSEFIED